MEKNIKILLAILLCLLPLLVKAQDCNDAYRRGFTLRQTATIDAQTRAINHFAEAYRCFTDEADKERCLRQISICSNTISRLGGSIEQGYIDELLIGTPEPQPTDNDTIAVTTEPEVPVVVSEFAIEFEYNDIAPLLLDGLCVTTDIAQVADKPDWVTDVIFTRDGKILIQVDENTSNEERTHTIVINEPGHQYLITVKQKAKKRILGIF